MTAIKHLNMPELTLFVVCFIPASLMTPEGAEKQRKKHGQERRAKS